MSMTIRRPGKHVFWVVQFKSKAYWADPWQEVGSSLIAKVPAALRLGPSYGSPDQEPFREWSACGRVWQTTGNNGFHKASDAMRMLELLTEHVPDREFRAVQVEITLTHLKIVELGDAEVSPEKA